MLARAHALDACLRWCHDAMDERPPIGAHHRPCRLAMARREITEAQVRQVLRAPQAVVAGNRPGREVAQGTV